MPVSSFQFAVCCSPFPGFTICHTRAWMTSDISPTSCWSVITCRGSGAQRNGGRGEEVSTCNNAQQCFALVRPIIPGRWMDERQACWELTSFRLAYTLSRCLNPSGPAPLLLRPSANRHYANLFADNVSRKHKNARRGGTSSSSSNVLWLARGKRKRVTVGWGRGIARWKQLANWACRLLALVNNFSPGIDAAAVKCTNRQVNVDRKTDRKADKETEREGGRDAQARQLRHLAEQQAGWQSIS